MNRKINSIKLYIKNSDYAKKVASELQKKLIKNKFKICNKKYDLAISIGGDGTFLKMIHENKFNDSIYYIGINAGALGFLTNVEVNYIDDFIDKLNKNKYFIKETYLLKTNIVTNSNTKDLLSVNELVIKESNSTLLKTNILIDNKLLEEYVGDGILISTSNGSTAYNLSFGGPILDPKLDVLSIIPIAPINNNIFKSLTSNLVISKDREITIKLKNKENICLIDDGKVLNINAVKEIKCSLSNEKIKLIGINEDTFVPKIKEKIIG